MELFAHRVVPLPGRVAGQSVNVRSTFLTVGPVSDRGISHFWRRRGIGMALDTPFFKRVLDETSAHRLRLVDGQPSLACAWSFLFRGLALPRIVAVHEIVLPSFARIPSRSEKVI
jgi:hypothetical protein